MYKINLYILLIISFVFYSSKLNSQNKYLTTDDSDKEAISLIKETKEQLKGYNSINFDYTFTSKSKGDEPVVIFGSGKQSGDKFFIEMGDKTVYCDGKDLIIFFNSQNEAQINDYNKEEDQMTPTSILNTFNERDFIFVMLANKRIKNKNFYNIILKPIDKYSDYIKVNILISKDSKLPYKIEMLMKDGTKNILEINSLKMNQKVDNSVFIFDKTKHPGVLVEDLRMN